MTLLLRHYCIVPPPLPFPRRFFEPPKLIVECFTPKLSTLLVFPGLQVFLNTFSPHQPSPLPLVTSRKRQFLDGRCYFTFLLRGQRTWVLVSSPSQAEARLTQSSFLLLPLSPLSPKSLKGIRPCFLDFFEQSARPVISLRLSPVLSPPSPPFLLDACLPSKPLRMRSPMIFTGDREYSFFLPAIAPHVLT